MAIGFTAYAYFSISVVTDDTSVKAAKWSLDVTCSDDIQPVDKLYTLDNTKGTTEKTYAFTLEPSREATAQTGYAKIEIKTDVDNFASFNAYYTKPIGTYKVNGIIFTAEKRVIKIIVPAGKLAIVKITDEWGSCAYEAFDDEKEAAITPNYAAVVQSNAQNPDKSEQSNLPAATNEPEHTEELNETSSSQQATEPKNSEQAESETNSLDNASASPIESNTATE